MTATQDQKTCVDCRHCGSDMDLERFCLHPGVVGDNSFGIYTRIARRGAACGPAATLFEPRQAEGEPAPKETLFVSTFMRGGSSLTMQMLEAAGAPVLGSFPIYEDGGAERLKPGASLEDWRQAHGKAAKLLEPQFIRGPIMPHARAIWLDRDPMQRAKSAIKFVEFLQDDNAPAVAACRADLAESYKTSRQAALQALLRLVGGQEERLLILRFEDLIREPFDAAAKIAEFAGLDIRRIGSMAAQVRARPATCLDYMLEEELLRWRMSAAQEPKERQA